MKQQHQHWRQAVTPYQLMYNESDEFDEVNKSNRIIEGLGTAACGVVMEVKDEEETTHRSR